MKKMRMILQAIAILFAVATVLVTSASPKVVTVIFIDYDQADCESEGMCTLGGLVSCLVDARVELIKHDSELMAIYDVDSQLIPCESVNPDGEFEDF